MSFSLKENDLHGHYSAPRIWRSGGAIEMGQHRFFHTGSTTPTGEADFVMLWVFRNKTWKISRVLSYNHHATK